MVPILTSIDQYGSEKSDKLKTVFVFLSADRVTSEKHLPLVGHVQIAAVPSRHEPDEGEVNYPAIFAALDRIGYDSWIGCEYRPRGRTEAGLGWARDYGVVPRDR